MTELTSTTIIVTGASSGLGRAAVAELAALGATVAVVGRNPERTRAVAAELGADPFLADFTSFDSVRQLAAELLDRYPRIDVLANNAGGLQSHRVVTGDGHEQTIQVNHLSPFLLTSLLLPRLLETAALGRSVRVISTASVAHRLGALDLKDLDWRNRSWAGGWRAYGSAKTATILFTRELARRTAGTGVSAYAFHPGFVSTRFGSDSRTMKIGARVGNAGLSISPEAGAAPLVMLAGAAEVPAPSGTYFDRLDPNGHLTRTASNDEIARRLWTLSEELTGTSALAAG
jgi:NAD(P)-dependent dehydrogenase (short-subunit alcohol dehydrogenase family)